MQYRTNSNVPERRIARTLKPVSDTVLAADLPLDLEINAEFRLALDLMEHTQDCLFITGRAGTGKSTLLKYFLQETQKNVAVVAPTGAAAINVRGETIHSFFKLPPRPIGKEEIRQVRDKAIYKKLDTIIIDEISMVRADLMDGIDQFLRLNGRHRNKPFGGIQLILIGDLFQLPPVVSSDAESQFITLRYASPYFFNAEVFQQRNLRLIELQRVYRQRDDIYLSILNGIRSNELDYQLLNFLNTRYQSQFEASEDTPFITLTTTNRRAGMINEQRLARLDTPLFTYEGDITGDFDTRALPTDQHLQLREGAQVMFIRNDPEHRWVNGSIGTVQHLGKDFVEVSMQKEGRKRMYVVDRVDFEMMRYRFDEETQHVKAEVAGRFEQYPLRLAYAITIHKSQGLTFDRVIIDLGSGTFAHGQAYVALSRCRTLDGLVLHRPMRLRDIIVDQGIVQFARKNEILPVSSKK